jgi:NAD(P)-dependent dehydrogenase (short-subunit alcohol dehydrogenase family)
MDPKGHAAIVTGAASGLGAETASALAKAGAKVALLDVNLDGAREVASKIGGIAIQCDVTSSDDAVSALAEAKAKHGAARSGRPNAWSAATVRCRSPNSRRWSRSTWSAPST